MLKQQREKAILGEVRLSRTICITWSDGTSTTYEISAQGTTSLSGDWLTLDSCRKHGEYEYKTFKVRVAAIREYGD